ncbi:hypothetical protein BKA60DRAFT_580377 [Fusarium oxysporum]|nr:hypothetical protein BKA60DRAFT_580377 [Fusarium oxysporum]
MSTIIVERRRGRDEDEVHIALQGPPECHEWIQKLRQPAGYAVPVFQGFISDDHMDDHPVYFKRYLSLPGSLAPEAALIVCVGIRFSI